MSVSSRPTAPRAGSARRHALLLLVGIVLASLNLRTAVTSTGALLDELRDGLPISGAGAGLLTTLPVLCFAVVGTATPWLTRRFGEELVTTLALGALATGSTLRVLASGGAAFLAASALALAGAAVGNVVIPALVKHHFPERIGPVTAAYTTALATGATLSAALTVPLADLTGSWRGSLAVWAGFAVVAVLPWLALVRSAAPPPDEPLVVRLAELRHSRTAWALALFFGTQALQAYVAFGWFAALWQDAGASPAQAGFLLAFLAALGIPASLVLPSMAGRMRTQRPLIVVVGLAYGLGYAGLLVAPGGAPAWVWAFLIGLGGGAFPLALTLIGLRTRVASTTAAVSASTQGLGYLLAAFGPFVFGVLHASTGGWNIPIVMLVAVLAVQVLVGWVAADDRFVEDELAVRKA